jgi:GDP-mannose 6-dehydrogenase
MNISIFGLGYVGAVSLACLARDGHQVIGVDIDPYKLELIRRGQSPIVEEGIQELMASVVAAGNVTVTDDVSEALQKSDISFICVGTPSAPNGSQDQTALLKITRQLGECLKAKESRHLLIFRSTVIPGTVEDVLVPLIEELSEKRRDVDFDVGFQPEFLREGTSIKDYDKPPFTIVGTASETARQTVQQLFGHLPSSFYATSVRTAEMVKYCCNTFHALKITFANEVARLCEPLRVDPMEVMELVCQDRQLNISPAYLKPGFAFGGSCLPKDIRGLLHMAKQRDVELPMIGSLLASNRLHVEHAVEKILATGERKVAVIGLAFKSGTDDLRESPLVALVEQLIGKGLQLLIYDPEVSLSRLLGTNKRYIAEHLPHLGELLCSDLQKVAGHGKVVVLGSTDLKLQNDLKAYLCANQLLIDVVSASNRDKFACRYEGLCW